MPHHTHTYFGELGGPPDQSAVRQEAPELGEGHPLPHLRPRRAVSKAATRVAISGPRGTPHAGVCCEN